MRQSAIIPLESERLENNRKCQFRLTILLNRPFFSHTHRYLTLPADFFTLNSSNQPSTIGQRRTPLNLAFNWRLECPSFEDGPQISKSDPNGQEKCESFEHLLPIIDIWPDSDSCAVNRLFDEAMSSDKQSDTLTPSSEAGSLIIAIYRENSQKLFEDSAQYFKNTPNFTNDIDLEGDFLDTSIESFIGDESKSSPSEPYKNQDMENNSVEISSQFNQKPSPVIISHPTNYLAVEWNLGCKTSVLILAIPSDTRPDALLRFIGYSPDLLLARIIIDSSVRGRYACVLQFENENGAESFCSRSEGRLFHPSRPERCHTLQLGSIQFATPVTSIIEPLFNETEYYCPLKFRPQKSLVQIPSCPACLERIDASATGVYLYSCEHRFHCDCSIRWKTSERYFKDCLVCKVLSSSAGLVQSPTTIKHGASIESAFPHTSFDDLDGNKVFSSNEINHVNTKEISFSDILLSNVSETSGNIKRTHFCQVCGIEDNLWVCLLCGIQGCGRYAEGHANDHYKFTGHAFSLELKTHRVWDYARDRYVHRLYVDSEMTRTNFQPASKVSLTCWEAQRLVEIPDPVTSNIDIDSAPIEVDEDTKILFDSEYYESLMAAKLESQRIYWEEKLSELKKERDLLIEKGEQEHEKRQEKLESRISTLLRQKKQLETELSSLRDKYNRCEHELDGERAISKQAMRVTEEWVRIAQNKDLQIEQLEEQVRDLMVHVETQQRIMESSPEHSDIHYADILQIIPALPSRNIRPGKKLTRLQDLGSDNNSSSPFRPPTR